MIAAEGGRVTGVSCEVGTGFRLTSIEEVVRASSLDSLGAVEVEGVARPLGTDVEGGSSVVGLTSDGTKFPRLKSAPTPVIDHRFEAVRGEGGGLE